MKTFEVCPRCKSDWKSERENAFPDCANCGMRDGFLSDELILPNILGKTGYHLSWDINNNKCYYGTVVDKFNGTLTQLPWLPYDITPDKLKLYLIFL